MASYKRHHYLPRFYLEGFADDDGRIWVYDRETGVLRRDTPVNTAVIGRYYDFEAAGGEMRSDVEALLSSIESTAKPVIEKLDRGKPITLDEQVALARHIAYLFGRVPQFGRAMGETLEGLVKWSNKLQMGTPRLAAQRIEEVRTETGEEPTVTPEQLAEFIERGEYSVTMRRNMHLAQMLSLGEKLTRLFPRMNWFVCRAPAGEPFLTTDAPFVIVPPSDHDPNGFTGGVGILTPGSFKFVPLTRRTTLAIGDPGPLGVRHTDIPRERMAGQNVMMASECDRLVIGPGEALVRDAVDRAEIAGTKPRPRMRVGS